jgi:hypothetical protein
MNASIIAMIAHAMNGDEALPSVIAPGTNADSQP